jgi:predicted metal-dependent hydrolase
MTAFRRPAEVPSLPAYTIRRSDRARRVRISVDPRGGIEVILPRGAREADAATAVTQLAPWIERRLIEADAAREAIAARGDTLPYIGEVLELVPERGRTRAHRRGDVLLVPAGDGQSAAIERWYRRAAHREIAPRLDRACREAGSRYTRLTIRGQRTRWASCSRTGAMSFNWRLLLAPEPVLDYVVWHEVCHLDVMDHSPRFWALLESRCPQWRVHQRWLRRHGATLVI